MSHSLVCLVFWHTDEVETDVYRKEDCADVFQPEDGLVTEIELDSREVGGCEAGVGDDYKHHTVPEGQDRLWCEE